MEKLKYELYLDGWNYPIQSFCGCSKSIHIAFQLWPWVGLLVQKFKMLELREMDTWCILIEGFIYHLKRILVACIFPVSICKRAAIDFCIFPVSICNSFSHFSLFHVIVLLFCWYLSVHLHVVVKLEILPKPCIFWNKKLENFDHYEEIGWLFLK